jgi:uncharacterized protein YndB with AHSA1/START domain
VPVIGPSIHLRLSRTFNAPRERVFRAWTDPEALTRWWAPEQFTCLAAEVDLRPGGRYRFTFREHAQGQTLAVGGEFKEVKAPERLVYTWRWEHWEAGMEESLVTVDLAERGGVTELALTHERFPEKMLCDRHEAGWGWTLDCLAKFLG